MNGRKHPALLLALLAAACAGAPPTATRERYEFERVRMGVPFRLVFYAHSDAEARDAATAVFARLRELDGILSDWNPRSELMRLCAKSGDGAFHRVSPDLWRVLVAAREFTRLSSGAFDVTVGPFVRLWRRARKGGELPSDAERTRAASAVGSSFVRLDERTRSVRLVQPHMRLDLGGIAKGYAIDVALLLLRERGIARALVDGGGDVAAGDPPPGADGWRVAVARLAPDAPAERTLLLKRSAVATSGDAFQFVEIGGVRYSHIIDPKTGLGLRERKSVTVTARRCMRADALATALSVLDTAAALGLAEERDIPALLVTVRDGSPGVATSSTFPR